MLGYARNQRILIIFPAFCALCMTPARASIIPPSQSDSAVRIRVRLAEAIPVVSIHGFDLRIHQTEEEGTDLPRRVLAHAPDRASSWEFRCEGNRVRAISARGGKALDLRAPVSVSTPAGMLQFRNRPYRDEMRIYPVGSLCEVVNELDIEKYLGGLVNAEFNSKWGEESTAAQVVAARTYALHQILSVRARKDRRGLPLQHFDVDATVKDQVYDGYFSEDFHGSRAVEKTRGIILTASVGGHPVPIKAFYHSTCAGRTELPQEVWGKPLPGFRHGVACPFCASSPRYSWQLDLSSREIAKLFLNGARADGAQPAWPREWLSVLREGRLADLRPVTRDGSGRWSRLATSWFFGKKIVELPVSGAKFRAWMGPGRFRSTLFDVIAHHDLHAGAAWHFRGKGNGHGVGLCQWGAKVMGERGYRMATILKHYYPDAVLRKLW